jgi:glycosyltransferase involved in cell wall biosynthesis
MAFPIFRFGLKYTQPYSSGNVPIYKVRLLPVRVSWRPAVSGQAESEKGMRRLFIPPQKNNLSNLSIICPAKMIKVAMIVRSTLYTVRGGDTIQAMQTARLLRCQGISVDIKLTNESINYRNYSLLHFFNLTRPADIIHHIRQINIPFVVSTIMIDYSEFDKYHRKGLSGLIFRYMSGDTIEYIKAISRWIAGKDKLMSASYVLKGQKRSIHEIIRKARLILPNSASEYSRIRQLYGCSTNYIVVPNAVDGDLFKFNSKVKKDPNLVICIARIEGLKNQANLIRALNNSRFRLILIGAPAPNQLSYYQMCRNLAASNVIFIDQMPQEQLVAYYQKAKVHALPSWFETTGLSSLEAASMGCNLVITEKGDTREYFGDQAIYCSPESPESIYAAVEKASISPYDESLQRKISREYTWQLASHHTSVGYRKILNNQN